VLNYNEEYKQLINDLKVFPNDIHWDVLEKENPKISVIIRMFNKLNYKGIEEVLLDIDFPIEVNGISDFLKVEQSLKQFFIRGVYESAFAFSPNISKQYDYFINEFRKYLLPKIPKGLKTIDFLSQKEIEEEIKNSLKANEDYEKVWKKVEKIQSNLNMGKNRPPYPTPKEISDTIKEFLFHQNHPIDLIELQNFITDKFEINFWKGCCFPNLELKFEKLFIDITRRLEERESLKIKKALINSLGNYPSFRNLIDKINPNLLRIIKPKYLNEEILEKFAGEISRYISKDNLYELLKDFDATLKETLFVLENKGEKVGFNELKKALSENLSLRMVKEIKNNLGEVQSLKKNLKITEKIANALKVKRKKI
jgi:hypothetical protein